MPSDTCPYVLREAIAKPPTSTAPGSDTTTRSPSPKLWAPQTIPRGPPSAAACSGPTSTVHQLIVLPFFCGSLATVSTRPTTTGPLTSPPWVASSSRPTRTSDAATSSGVAPARVDRLGEPRQRDAHQPSIPYWAPNWALKRTSPSTMSRMSATPLRNIRVRSTPMPKANPE